MRDFLFLLAVLVVSFGGVAWLGSACERAYLGRRR